MVNSCHSPVRSCLSPHKLSAGFSFLLLISGSGLLGDPGRKCSSGSASALPHRDEEASLAPGAGGRARPALRGEGRGGGWSAPPLPGRPGRDGRFPGPQPAALRLAAVPGAPGALWAPVARSPGRPGLPPSVFPQVRGRVAPSAPPVPARAVFSAHSSR